MSTHKWIDKICVVVILIALLVTVLFMNGKKLGMESIVDMDAETYEGPEYITANDLNGDWDSSDATVITLKGDSAKVKGKGAYVDGTDIVIKNGGYYVVSGTLENGRLIVDTYESSKVWIRLDGVTMYNEEDACIRVEEADKVFLTLGKGTQNELACGESFSESAIEDGAEAVIFSHDDLTINGSGSLTITAPYKHGIKANDDLVLAGGTVVIDAKSDAIHVNEDVALVNTDLTINAGDDAVTTEGTINVENADILVNECYEGLEANVINVYSGNVEIYPEDDGFNARGDSDDSVFGAPGGMNMGTGGPSGGPSGPFGDASGDSVSGNSASGNPDFGGERPEFDPTDMPDMSDMPSPPDMSEMPDMSDMPTPPDGGEMPGGFERPEDGESNDDAANESEAAGTDDVTGADSGDSGNEEKNGSQKRFKGERPDFANGSDKSDQFRESDSANENDNSEDSDDKKDSKDEEDSEPSAVNIYGGTIRIINDGAMDADGIDSNGDVRIYGGYVFVSLTGNGVNNAIDYGSESGGVCVIDGGTVIACGGSSMAEKADASSKQASIFYTTSDLVAKEQVLTITNEAGEQLLSETIPCSYACALISIPELEIGQTYQVSFGDKTEELTLEEVNGSFGDGEGGMNFGGFGMGKPNL